MKLNQIICFMFVLSGFSLSTLAMDAPNPTNNESIDNREEFFEIICSEVKALYYLRSHSVEDFKSILSRLIILKPKIDKSLTTLARYMDGSVDTIPVAENTLAELITELSAIGVGGNFINEIGISNNLNLLCRTLNGGWYMYENCDEM